MEEIFNLITFESTHASIKAESILNENNISNKIINIPMEITAGCGFAIKIECDYFETAVNLLKNQVELSNLYKVTKIGLSKHIEKL